jgi:hypothetical protein
VTLGCLEKFVTLGCLEKIGAEKKPTNLIRIMPAEGVVTGRLSQTLRPPPTPD